MKDVSFYANHVSVSPTTNNIWVTVNITDEQAEKFVCNLLEFYGDKIILNWIKNSK